MTVPGIAKTLWIRASALDMMRSTTAKIAKGEFSRLSWSKSTRSRGPTYRRLDGRMGLQGVRSGVHSDLLGNPKQLSYDYGCPSVQAHGHPRGAEL